MLDLFNTHEKWGILIAILCFVAGFPSNLLSIFVCLKSLRWNSAKKRRKRLSYDAMMATTSFKRRKSSSCMQQNTTMTHTKERTASLLLPTVANNAEPLILFDAAHQQQRKATIASLTPQYPPIGRLSSYNKVVNPHRKCFELYLIEISVCDLVILTYHFIEWSLLVLSRYNILDKQYSEPIYISQFMCRFVIALNRTVILLHNWLVALLALTRCYAIYRPLNLHTFFSSKFYCRLNLYILLALLILFVTVNTLGVAMLTHVKTAFNITTPLLESSNSSTTNIEHYRLECKFKEELYSKYKYLDVYTNLAIGIVGYSLPIIITLLINIALIFNLRQLLLYKTNILRGSSSTSQQHQRKSIDERKTVHLNRMKFFKTTSSLLFISFSYLICYIPFTLLFLLMSLEKLNMNVDLIFVFTNLRYVNHTLNFFIYYATGKRFRNDVKSFFKFNNK